MGLSLWLVPPEPQATQLSRIMSYNTGTSQSPASFPRFHPHITLLTVPSITDLSTLRSAVPSGQPKIPIHFKSVDVGTEYYMSVYVVVHHTAELTALRESIMKNRPDDKVPPLSHVSLFYIDPADAAERNKICDILVDDGRIVNEGIDSVTLDCTEGQQRGKDLMDGFIGGEIWIALCDGPVETWVVKDKIPLV
ncbi:hypothetical protein QCA50_015266 [Cerrena zonata]|uniref:LigT-like protein n=1 Tax=Cerrena zonata TaxID=2478898 RepID=A0AAW0FTF9_9APHY